MEYIEIIHGVALLFLLVVLFAFILQRWIDNPNYKNIFFGIIFGFITIVGMSTPFVIQEGLFFDIRSVLLGLSGLFGGPLAGIISSSIAAFYRYELGGVGLLTGIISIYISSIMGVIAYYFYKRCKLAIDAKLLIIGFAIHFFVLLGIFSLPDDIQMNVIYIMSFPYLVVFPLAFWLFGKILLTVEDEVRNRKLLKESQERLFYALEGSQSGVWDWNLQENSFFYTAQWKHIIGYKDNELQNTYDTWYSRIHPDDIKQALKDINDHRTAKTEFYENKHRLKHKDGSWIWVLSKGKIVSYDKAGKPMRMVGTNADINESKLFNKKIANLTSLYNSVIDSIENIIFVKDNTFSYIACNTSFCNFVGKSKQEIMGRNDYELFDKKTADFFRKKDINMVEIGTAQSNFEWVTYPNGHEEYLLTSKSPLIDSDGHSIGLVGNSVAFTEYKRLQDQLEEAQSLISLGSWEYDIEADVLLGSKEIYNIYGIKDTEQKLQKFSFFSMYHPDDVLQAEEDYKNSLSSKRPTKSINRIIRVDNGEVRYVEHNWRTVFKDNKAVKTIGTTQDVTQREVMKNKILSSEEKYQAIVEQPLTGIYIFSSDKIIYANQRFWEMFGYSVDEILSLKPTDLIALEYRKKVTQELENCCFGKVLTTHYIVQGLRKNGEIFWVEIYGSKINLKGEWVVTGNIIDITHRVEAEKEKKDFLLDTIKAIALTVEKRDPYTSGHQNRVAELAVAIGRELKLSDDRLEGLMLGATIHDIGKIYIPAEILNRPGVLSENEFGIIKTHPSVGYEIIENIKTPWPIKEMVVQHHERIDGSGYPNGLKGDEIILEAKILSVADVVEAINSHRPYRPALGIEIAIKELEKGKNTIFDEKVVEACLEVIKNNAINWIIK